MAHELIPEILEEINDIAPGQSGFGQDGGSATLNFEFERDELPNFLVNTLGTTLVEMVPGDDYGRLKRYPPMAHPTFPWLYASRITSLQGIGADGYATSDEFVFPAEGQVFRLMPERVGYYKHYRAVVQFEPRPYEVLFDSQTHVWKTTGGQRLRRNHSPNLLRPKWALISCIPRTWRQTRNR
jgi:hypothetical protein